MVDFKKLAGIQPGKETKTPVQDSKKVNITEEENPLNALVTDNPETKTRVLILDSVQIKKIMEGPRDKRRKFLSLLTDSQRRRVLEAEKRQPIADSGFSQELAFLLLDQALANYYFDPTKFNKDAVLELIKSPVYQFPEDLITKVEVVSNNDFNMDLDDTKEAYTSIVETIKSNRDGQCQLEKVVTTDTSKAPEQEIPEEPEDTGKELDEEVSTRIVEKAKEDFKKSKENGESIFSLADDSIAQFVSEGYKYDLVSDLYTDTINAGISAAPEVTDSILDEAFAKKYGKTISEFMSMKIMDKSVADVLDLIKDKDYIDESNELENSEQTIATQLNEALTDYANGNTEKLDALLNAPVPQEKKMPEESEVVEGSEEDIDIEDAKKVCQAVLNKDNKIIDEYRSKVEALQKFNFRISDCDMTMGEFTQTPTPLPPLTRDEYCTLIPPVIPCYFDMVVAQYPQGLAPQINEVTCDDRCVIINGEQKYLPYNCTPQELCAQLQEAPVEERQRILGSCACEISDALKIFAKTNNLNLIDNKFYKKYLTDSTWCFDEKPDCISDSEITSGTLELVKDVKEDDKVVTIFGQTYKLV